MYTLHRSPFPPELTAWFADALQAVSTWFAPPAKATPTKAPQALTHAPVAATPAPAEAPAPTPEPVRMVNAPHHVVASAFGKWDRLPEHGTPIVYDVAGPKRSEASAPLFDVEFA